MKASAKVTNLPRLSRRANVMVYELVKQCAHVVRYDRVDPETGKPQALYVPNAAIEAIGAKPPKRIRVTVEAA